MLNNNLVQFFRIYILFFRDFYASISNRFQPKFECGTCKTKTATENGLKKHYGFSKMCRPKPGKIKDPQHILYDISDGDYFKSHSSGMAIGP